jgi:hypothetical protein
LVNPWQGESVPSQPRQVAMSPQSIASERRDSAGPSRTSIGGYDPYRNSPLTPQDSNEDIPSPLVPLSSTPTSMTATTTTTATSPPARVGHRPSFSDKIRGRFGSSFSLPTRTNTSQDSLPSESNNFLGLCKSAWRLQVGADESAIMIGKTLVSGTFSQTIRHWVCKSSGCRFEGMIIKNDLDRRMIKFSDQLIFKWTFLFKCHLPAKTGDDKAYGCVFCASPVGPTIGALPVFRGDRAFLMHIQDQHIGDGRWPTGPTKYRVGCTVDSDIPEDNTWDILLIRTGPAELDASPPSPRLAASPPSLDMQFEGFGTFEISENDDRRNSRPRGYSRP